ncbi:MAG TPA: class I SAM-dependent methyltransferase [Gaiellaceae bacterium]
MARISYDERTAAAYKAARELPRAGLLEWREAVGRHLRPTPETTVVDVGAGTGQFATAFRDWFDVRVVAVEPAAAMRRQIPRTDSIHVVAGDATAIPVADASADAAWLSLVVHHIADLEAAAGELRRILRPGAPVLIRQGFPGRVDGVELVRWFPETARVVDSYPTVEEVCDTFAAAGFRRDALEQVVERYGSGLASFLAALDTFRAADTTMRSLTDDEYERGKARVRRAVGAGLEDARSNRLDLLVLRPATRTGRAGP